jgi:DNA-binding transcriptional regulator YiaG
MIDKKQPKLDTRNISLNLYRLRTQGHLTHEQFAEMLNVSVRIVYSWENGTKLPGLGRVILIATVFQVTVDSILRLS